MVCYVGSCGIRMTAGNAEKSAVDNAKAWATPLPTSVRSKRTINPIREFVQSDPPRKFPTDRKLIKLSNGDPTTYGNLKPPKEVVSFFVSTIDEGTSDGYSLSMGAVGTRKAVARWASSLGKTAGVPFVPYTDKDVYLCAGASGALESVLGTIADEGDNILVPSPGFPLFRTVAGGYGIETRAYSLDPERFWEVDLESIEALVDTRTKAILLNNPSNPCGSVYSAKHCQDLADLAARLRVPIVCDEIYADMAFSGSTFTPMASVAENVPVLTVGGISKKFVVPGWRLGWILVHDPVGALSEVREGLRKMSTRMLCPATPVQRVVEYMLDEFGDSSGHLSTLMDELETNAEVTFRRLNQVEGLRCIRPQGSMYAMVHIDTQQLDFEDDFEFAVKLYEEEAVEVLPGRCFQAENFYRVVFAAPAAVLEEAYDRIDAFCTRHRR